MKKRKYLNNDYDSYTGAICNNETFGGLWKFAYAVRYPPHLSSYNSVVLMRKLFLRLYTSYKTQVCIFRIGMPSWSSCRKMQLVILYFLGAQKLVSKIDSSWNILASKTAEKLILDRSLALSNSAGTTLILVWIWKILHFLSYSFWRLIHLRFIFYTWLNL